jgi:hypothetical protein
MRSALRSSAISREGPTSGAVVTNALRHFGWDCLFASPRSRNPGRNAAAFALIPLRSSPIKANSGTATSCCWTRRFIQRDGQSIEIDNPLRTFEGKRVRAHIAWVDLGSGYSVGTGTWKIVRGAGAYAHLEGHGRIALITDANDQGPVRAEGLVDLRG